MLETTFVQHQRDRLLRRIGLYAVEIGREDLPAPMRAHKAHVLRVVIPRILSRIDGGAYGSCIECGEDIPQRRLELVPTALRCVTCQSQFDEGRS